MIQLTAEIGGFGLKVIKSRIKTTVTLPGVLFEVALAETWQDTGKSLTESTQHQNDFNGDEFSRNEFSSTVHCLIAIHRLCEYSKAGIPHLFISKLHTHSATP